MNTKNAFQLYDELDDFDLNEQGRPRHALRNPKKAPFQQPDWVVKQDDSRANFKFSYKAARFEEGWLLDSLGAFYEHRWISDVLSRVKGGKEASVYLCAAGAEVPETHAVVKVYRPRRLRNLKNDAAYREGRIDLNGEGKTVFKDGDRHAMQKRSAYGEELRHTSWIAHEFNTLQNLFEAGADVPRPYEMANNAILMGYIGDLDGPAPALNEVSLDRAEARTLFDRVIQNLNILLSQQRVHGDLSAYNILYWEGSIALIDFPQVVSPLGNRNAFGIFKRDVTRLCEYFDRQGLRTNPSKLAADLWTRHGYQVVEEIHPGLLDADDPKDRALWKKQSK